MSTFAERLRILRGTKQSKEFAEAAGISAGSLSAYENGTAMPTARTLSRISENLKVPMEWLLSGDSVLVLPPAISESKKVATSPLLEIANSYHAKNIDPEKSKTGDVASFGTSTGPSPDLLQEFLAQNRELLALSAENRQLLREIGELREERAAWRVERELLRERLERQDAELERLKIEGFTPSYRAGAAPDAPEAGRGSEGGGAGRPSPENVAAEGDPRLPFPGETV